MWKQELKRAFGIVDKCFARHPMDQARAKEARKLAKQAGATWSDIEAEITSILKGSTDSHVQEQLKAARAFFKL
ncbi:hypothetical protein [Pseudomonas knackmussii]|uniref:hypothetical protein n=1 Tax=Pseudomonas knackmussii TaxID=65741 RepID=UPI0013620051|nr:hypothetical protein [Pseudomonas knackmussii]